MNNVMLRMGAIMLLAISALATPLVSANAQQAKSIPAKGAVHTNNWDEWNLFKQRKTDVSPYPRKYSDTAINNKLTDAYNKIFKTGNPNTQRICFDDPSDPTQMAYVKSISDNDVRSEGISYGMMVAVQRDDQPLFKKLWKFARKYLKQDKLNDPQQGYFAWKVNLNPNGTVKYNPNGTIDRDPTSAPDGDIWMAMALFNASGRWGNNTTEWPFNYKEEANHILKAMLHREEWNNGTPNGLTNIFVNNQVVLVPLSAYNYLTDPSYHLPAFLEYFARYGGQDNIKWWDITEKSRQYLLPRATGYIGNGNNNSNTALSPDYSNLEGIGASFNGSTANKFSPEAHRVISNIAVDYMWWGGTDNNNNYNAKWNFHKNFGNRLLSFFTAEGKIGLYGVQGEYPAVYTTNGQRSTNPNDLYSSITLIAMNATGAQIASQSAGNNTNNDYVWRFVDKLMTSNVPEGDYRYYGSCLYMLGLLQCSGQFRFWAPQ
jgi:oligosaccharide reducing-end xylanase